MNRVAPVTVKLVSVDGSEGEEKLRHVFDRIFLKAQQNILLKKRVKMGLVKKIN